MGWFPVETEVKPVYLYFQSTQHKSSLPYPQSHVVNILRAGPAPLSFALCLYLPTFPGLRILSRLPVGLCI